MRALFLAGALLLGAAPLYAADHLNLDAGHPLDFDDAESVALGEKNLEVGATLSKPKQEKAGLGASAGFVSGFAPNSQFSLDFSSQWMSSEVGERRFDVGDINLGLLHNFNRELEHSPAYSLCAGLSLPTGRDSRGLDLRLRAIASRHLGQYDRLHLNLDLGANNSPAAGERRWLPGLILGYSKPMGFTRTWLGQIAWRANELRGEKAVLNVGVGMRQQIGVRSVADIGLKSDISGGANRQRLSLVAGYSRQF